MKLNIIGSGDVNSIYNGASYLIDDLVLFDIPNGSMKSMFRMGIIPAKIKHLLISHYHGDHYFDVPFFLLKRLENKNSLTIYTDRLGFKKIKTLTKLAYPNTVNKIYKKININLVNDKAFKLYNYDVERIKVKHSSSLKNNYGYIFKSNKITVSFTGDSSECEAVYYMASTSDYLICDTTLIRGNDKHMGIDSIKKLVNLYPNCTYILSHLNDKTRESLEKENIKNIIIAKDGDELILKK